MTPDSRTRFSRKVVFKIEVPGAGDMAVCVGVAALPAIEVGAGITNDGGNTIGFSCGIDRDDWREAKFGHI